MLRRCQSNSKLYKKPQGRVSEWYTDYSDDRNKSQDSNIKVECRAAQINSKIRKIICLISIIIIACVETMQDEKIDVNIEEEHFDFKSQLVLQAVSNDRHNGYEVFAKRLEKEAKEKQTIKKIEEIKQIEDKTK